MKKVINNFKPMGGKHCITTALRQVFEYYHYSLSEEMIFGIGSGLSFCYIQLAYSPMVSGRIKVFEFEKKIADRLNIDIKCKSSQKYETTFHKTVQLLNEDKPVLVYVDMPYLDYLALGHNSHFGGHAVVIMGYDDENKKFYISDRDNSDNPIRTPKGSIAEDYHMVSYNQVEKARSSHYRPFPAKNKYLDICIQNPHPITKSILFSAIQETCESMLNAPAQLLGLNGIRKFSKEILKWSKFDDHKLNVAAITNYFQISADGGTGGGIFRKMYGQFLIEASYITHIDELKELGNQYIYVSQKWDKIADSFWELSETLDRDLLEDISLNIKEIHNDEYSILERLNQIVRS